MEALASAPAKVILTGEHFVVYNKPAIVMAIDLRAKVRVKDNFENTISIFSNLGYSGTYRKDRYYPEKGGVNGKKILDPMKIAATSVLKYVKETRGLLIEVDSKIPVASGLGSSAAVVVATVAATGKKLGVDLSKEEIINLSLEAEKHVHVNPSGIDQTISTYGGIILYKKNEISIIDAPHNIPIIIGNSGVPRVTGDLVSKVRRMTTIYPQITKYIIQAAGLLTIKAVDALKERNFQLLGELMSLNHGMLVSIGVSSFTLDNLVYAAKRGGALGTKLTGAGGGGCIIALCTTDRIDTVMEEISKVGGTSIFVKKADRGVVTWLEN